MKKNITPKSIKQGLMVGALLLMIVGLVLFITFENKQPERVVALVNGEPISEQEFKMQMTQNRAYVYNYFQRKYKVSDGPKFWETGYGGEVPIKVARDKTLNECVRIKVQQILAKQKEILWDITFGGFLEDLKKENTRRKEAVSQGKAIYGPQQYDETGYYRYLFENRVIQLKDKLAENELKVSDTQLRQYYEEIKDKQFRKENLVTILKLTLPYNIRENENIKREEAQATMEQIRNKLLNGAGFRETAQSYKLKSPLKLTCSEQVMDSNTGRFDSRNNPILRHTADETEVGQISPVFEEKNALIIIKCIAKKSGGYYDFNEYKDVIQGNLVDAKYNDLIDRLVKEAKVEIKKEVYQRLTY